MMDLILQGLFKLISSFVGTFGFAIFMHAPKRAWLPASAIGGAAYTLYWALLQFSMYEPMAMFLAALVGSMLGQYCARRMQMIASIAGVTIKRLNCADVCALGAAMIAACGAGFFRSFREAADAIVSVEQVFTPISEEQTYYNEKFRNFDRLWQCLSQFYKGD